MKLIKFVYQYIVGIIGIILISCIPIFFKGGLNFNLVNYFKNVYIVLEKLFHPNEWIIHYVKSSRIKLDIPLFDFVSDGYLYSMIILFSSILLALFIGFILAYIVFLLPNSVQSFIKKILNIIETFPDVIVILLLQLIVVWVFKHTGLLIFEFAYLGDERIFFAPILSLTFLPTILFFKIIYLLLEEEWQKNYVVFAKSKGFKDQFILMIHCIRNLKVSFFLQSKPIVWSTLSSLLVIEYFFNFYGIVRLVLFDTRPFVITAAFVLLFTPFYIIYNVVEMVFIKEQATSSSTSTRFAFNKSNFTIPKIRIKQLLLSWIKAFKQFLIYMKELFKKPKFLFGFIYLFGFLLVSIIYSIVAENPVKHVAFLYDDNHHLLDAPPYSPSKQMLLGSDPFGYSILGQLIVGAKYTIFFTGLIAFLRVGLSYLLSIPYLFLFSEKFKKTLSKLADGMQFLPLSLITYILVQPIVLDQQTSSETTLSGRIFLEVIILTVLVIPVVLNVIGNEMNQISKEEFILSSITLGSSRRRIFFKHLTPQVFPRLIYLFGQQWVQVLIIFMHLAVFNILFGGFASSEAPVSPTHEWAGIIVFSRIGLMLGNYYMIIPMLIAYVLLVLSIQAIITSMISSQQSKIGVISEKQKTKTAIKEENIKPTLPLKKSDFEPVENM